MKLYLKLLVDFLKRDLRSQYAGSLLGFAWVFVGPVAQILIYTTIFGFLFKTRPVAKGQEVSYVVFLCASLIPWNLFSQTLTRTTHSFLEHAPYLKKLPVPSHLFITYPTLSSLVPFGVLFSGLLFMQVILGGQFNLLGVFAYLFLFGLFLLFLLGLSLTLASLNVFYRDVMQALPLVLQVLFWGTPVVYPLDLLPPWAQTLVNLSPFTPFIMGFRNALFVDLTPLFWNLVQATGITTAFLAFGVLIYSSLNRWIVDEL